LLSDFGKSTAPGFSTLGGSKSDGKPADERSGFGWCRPGAAQPVSLAFEW